MNPLMTGYAERHQIALVMCSTITERLDMMHKRREDVSALLFALLAERMPRQVTVANPTPRTAIPLVLIVPAREAVIMSLHDFLMLLAIPALPVREIGTACHAARAFRFPRHLAPLFEHEKTSAGIAPVGGYMSYTLSCYIISCQVTCFKLPTTLINSH